MNIIKIGLVLLTGAGFGLGLEQLSNTNITSNNNDYGNHMYEDEDRYNNGFCHNNDVFLDHMLDNLNDEEKVLVQEKIDELLVEYDIDLEDLNDNYDLRHDFMYDLMEFLEENEIYYHRHNRFYDNDSEEDDWYHGMRMH